MKARYMKIDKITLNEIKPATYNPRIMSIEEQEKLEKNLQEFGLVDPIIINLKNNQIIGGHQRYKILQKEQEKTGKQKEFTLIQMGDIGWVFLDEDMYINDENHEKALNLALNKISGEWDYTKLESILDDLQKIHFKMDLTGFDINLSNLSEEINTNTSLNNILNHDKQQEPIQEDIPSPEVQSPLQDNNENSNKYIQTTNIPQYTIKGETPALNELYNLEYVETLTAHIEQANITEEQKKFLKYAAYRHILFNYENIAEYYAHQNKEMQQLIEESCLVIIDFNDALKNGYIQMNKQLKQLMNTMEDDSDEV